MKQLAAVVLDGFNVYITKKKGDLVLTFPGLGQIYDDLKNHGIMKSSRNNYLIKKLCITEKKELTISRNFLQVLEREPAKEGI